MTANLDTFISLKDDSDLDMGWEPGEPEETADTCPDCKQKGFLKWFEQDGPDDYRIVWECLHCHERWES